MSQVAIMTDCVDGYDAGHSTGDPGDTQQGLLTQLWKFRKSIPGETEACTESQNVSNSYIRKGGGGAWGRAHKKQEKSHMQWGLGSELYHNNSDPCFRRAVFQPEDTAQQLLEQVELLGIFECSGGIFIKQRTDLCVRGEKKNNPSVLFSEPANVHIQVDTASSRPTGVEHLSLSCEII